tara:strand:- start:185 stop:808 length:624 start_codon:yes stop_codon:yes gene_type:complete
MSNIEKNNYSIIFSDLFGVLLGPDYSDVINYIQNITHQPFNEIYSKLFDESSMRLIRGEIDLKFYFNQLQYKIKNGNDLKFEKFQYYWDKMKVGEMPLVKYLLGMKKSYQICILTNTTQRHIGALQLEYSFINEFNYCITSDVAHSYKPNPEIFHYACRLLNVKMNEAIFIDDNEDNVQTARNLGMLGCHYQTYTQFLKFITKYKIN